jgi:hypothetical protein
MTAAKKTATRSSKIRGDEENPTASIPGEEPPPAPATRASNLIPGTELDTAPGPQEVGATRGARRPATQRIRGSRIPSRRVISPFRNARSQEQREAIEEAQERADEWTAAQSDRKLKPTPVVATRTGYYGGKRRRAGELFGMKLPKGWTEDDLPSWVEKAGTTDREEVELEDIVESAEDADAI